MIWENLINSIKDRFAVLSPEQKRLFVIFCTVGFSVILILVVVVSVVKNRPAADYRFDDSRRQLINAPIPAEELFLPEEPDFLPGVLVDRERRDAWTAENAEEFWQDPLRAGEEHWRGKIEAAVDELLERIP